MIPLAIENRQVSRPSSTNEGPAGTSGSSTGPKGMDEIFRVERELQRINLEIETLKGQISRLSHLTLFSTITVNTREQVSPGPVGWVVENTWKSLKWLVVRN